MARVIRPVAGVLACVLVAGGCATGAPATGGAAGAAGPPVTISVSDDDALTDEPVAVTVGGLSPGTAVTLWAARGDDLGRSWLAHATFTAGADGRVDVGSQAPAAGTYDEADPMGLFWSMRPADGSPPGPPFPVAADPVARVALTAQVDGVTVAGTEVVRRAAAPGVRREPVHRDGLVGMLHLPSGVGPHPAVVLVSGSEGGVPRYDIAGLLASRGFATLALAHFGAEGLPAELVRIPLEYFERAFGWLRARPDVADGPLGVIGPSRGGELALLLGATFPEVGAVVSYVGSGLGHAGLPASFTGAQSAAWTYAGRDVPFVVPPLDGAAALGRYLVPSVTGAPITDVAGTWSEFHAAGPAARAAAEIPVERIDGPVLLLSGLADRLWPSVQLSDVALRRLESRGHAHRHVHLSYPGAGHFFIGAP